MEVKQSLFDNNKTIMFKKQQWTVINRSPIIKDNRIKDYFIVALSKSGKRVLSYLESNMTTYHIDNWNTFHNKLWKQWLNK